jgi:hypothetical protein
MADKLGLGRFGFLSESKQQKFHPSVPVLSEEPNDDSDCNMVCKEQNKCKRTASVLKWLK